MTDRDSQGPDVPLEEWSNSLFSCGPCNTCLLSTFLPCTLLGRTSSRMRDPTMQTAESCNRDCWLFCCIQCVTGCGWIYAMMKRREIRERFQIKGSCMNDYCASYWCYCCALVQQDEEVKARHARGPITQGYQSERERMEIPPASGPVAHHD